MNKSAIGNVTRAYHDYVGSKPIIEAPVLGALGAATGYYGAGFVIPKLLKVLMAGKTEQEKADMMKEYESENTEGLLRNLLGVAGGAAGVGYSLNKHLDLKGGLKGAFDSLSDQNYWSRPEVRERVNAARDSRMAALRYTPQRTYSSGRSLAKQASLEYSSVWAPNMEQERVPIAQSLTLIQRDPFLTLPQKDVTTAVLEGAEDSDSGLTSGKKLMRSAVQLGVGAATGYLFGKATSSLLSLPAMVTRRLSGTGAIAGALINTGIFSEL